MRRVMFVMVVVIVLHVSVQLLGAWGGDGED